MGPDPAYLFDQLAIERDAALIVAVSGGSDSLALLLLVADFLKTLAAPPRLVAVTIDHRLRAQAAQEADTVAALCRTEGIAHRTLAWQEPKPETGLPAAAREARYRLLAQAAQEAGATMILTGHTLDDQAETVAMRRTRRDTGRGLAGMARATLLDERIWIVRPLLGLRRQALRDFLRHRGIGWADDPTNEDPLFERARTRMALEIGRVETLATHAKVAGLERQALAQGAADLAAQFATHPAPGLFRLDPALFASAEPQALHLLRLLLATVGGTPHLPQMEQAETLFARLGGGGRVRATLSRALIDARDGGIWLMREARAVAMTPVCTQALWDGRWRIEANAPAPGLFIGPLGAAAGTIAAPAARVVPQSLAHAALSAEPGLFEGGRLVCPAQAGLALSRGVSAAPVAAPFFRFLPEFDLATAAALRRLLGRPPLPASPWRNHIDRTA